jgi:hypothetical protein
MYGGRPSQISSNLRSKSGFGLDEDGFTSIELQKSLSLDKVYYQMTFLSDIVLLYSTISKRPPRKCRHDKKLLLPRPSQPLGLAGQGYYNHYLLRR